MAWPVVGAMIGGTIISGIMQSQAAGKASSAQLKGAREATAAELEMFYQGREDMAPWREAGKWALGYQDEPVPIEPLLSYEDWRQQQGMGAASPEPRYRSQTRDEFDMGIKPRPTIDSTYSAYRQYADDWNERKGQTRMSDTFREGSLMQRIQEGAPTAETYIQSPYYNWLLGKGIEAQQRGASARGNVLSGKSDKDLMRYGQGLASLDYDKARSRWFQDLTPLQSMAGLGQTTAVQGAQMGTQVGRSIGQNYLAAGRARASGYINQANIAGAGIKSGVENYLMYNYMNRQPMQRDISHTQYL